MTAAVDPTQYSANSRLYPADPGPRDAISRDFISYKRHFS